MLIKIWSGSFQEDSETGLVSCPSRSKAA
uniref:Uncharacterized protein n=1 Tax=Arundo donax TaxID=35708 RepID=A0A0A9EJC7_ARUDO